MLKTSSKRQAGESGKVQDGQTHLSTWVSLCNSSSWKPF